MEHKILIVDDHHLFAQSLKIMVQSFPNCQVIQTLCNGKELVKFLQKEKNRPDLILLDINMPEMNGLETMQWLKQNYPQQKVLALSMEDDETTIIKMIHHGVRGYILKDIQPQYFRKAIEAVINDDFYYSDIVAEKISAHNNASKALQGIKEKEMEFLKLVCTEMTYKEVAAKMQLSPKTIENYRESLFQKLGVRSRIGLVLYAIKNEIFNV